MDRCGGGAPTGSVLQREGGRIVLTPPGSIPHGATALRRSVRKVSGEATLTNAAPSKRGNVTDHLAEAERAR